MEKKSYIYPGTIFTAKAYDPFTKKILIHPFVCVYNQALDGNLSGETNILALLITSNSKQLLRQIPILKSKNPFLDKDSFCYANNIYMFLVRDATVIGQLDSDTFFAIVQKRQLMLRGENDQCVKSLMNMKAYESKNPTVSSSEPSSAKHTASKEISKAVSIVLPILKIHTQPQPQKQNKPSQIKQVKHINEQPNKNNQHKNTKLISKVPVTIGDSHQNKNEKQKNRKFIEKAPIAVGEINKYKNKPRVNNHYKNPNLSKKGPVNISEFSEHKNTQIKSEKIIEKGPVIIGEPHQQKFVNNLPQKNQNPVAQPKKKYGFFKKRPKQEKKAKNENQDLLENSVFFNNK